MPHENGQSIQAGIDEQIKLHVTIGLNRNGFFGKLINEQPVKAAFFSATPGKSQSKYGNMTVSEAERLYADNMAEPGFTKIIEFRFAPWSPNLPRFRDFVCEPFAYHPHKYWGWQVFEWADFFRLVYENYSSDDAFDKTLQEELSELGDCHSC
ncbi:hypothetical protein HAP94_14445 [Acidithiobacillus ferrivorans]|nr:hypothetical protein [Acidithiobacillus ferrivorans]